MQVAHSQELLEIQNGAEQVSLASYNLFLFHISCYCTS